MGERERVVIRRNSGGVRVAGPEMVMRDAAGLRRRRFAGRWCRSPLSSQAEELHERTGVQTIVWTSLGRGERDAPGAATHALAGGASARRGSASLEN